MGVIKRSFEKHFKTKVKAKVVRRGNGDGGFEGITTPACPPPPPENFNHTFTIIIPSRCNSHATNGNWIINDA